MENVVQFLSELWRFLKVRKKVWLLPVILVGLLGAVFLVGQGSAIAPIIYVLL